MGNESSSSANETSLGDRAAMNSGRSVPSSTSTSSSSSARKGPERHIFLNIYEPSGKAAQQQPNVPGFGVYHSGIEILGTEWTFAGGGSGSGVCQQTPKVTPIGTDWKYKQSVDLGVLTINDAQLLGILREFEVQWPASSYHIVHRNCNHFTEAVATRLGLEYPAWVNRAANFGKHFIAKPSSVDQGIAPPEPPKPSIFQSSKGHRLDDSASPPPKQSSSGFSSLFKKKEENVPATASTTKKANPWANPDFKLAQQAKGKTTTSTTTPSSSSTTSA